MQGDPWVLVLPWDLSAVAQARVFVQAVCRAVGVADDAGELAVLLTSETVTNAFIHGRSSARLSVRAAGSRVRVEVSDDNSRHPQPVEPDDQALDGRGLAILDMLAAGWGVHDEPVGKTVWFEVDGDLDA